MACTNVSVYLHVTCMGLVCLYAVVRRAAIRRAAAVEHSFSASVSSVVAEIPTLLPTNAQKRNAIENAALVLRRLAKRGDVTEVAVAMWRAAQRGDVAMLRICLASKVFFDSNQYWQQYCPEYTAFTIAARNGHVDCVKRLLFVLDDEYDLLAGFRCAIHGHAGAEMLSLLMHNVVTRPNTDRNYTVAYMNHRFRDVAAVQRNAVALNVMADAADAEFAAELCECTDPHCSHAPELFRLCDACRARHGNRLGPVREALQSAVDCGDTQVVAHLLQRQCMDDRSAARTWWLRAQECRRLHKQRRRQETGAYIPETGAYIPGLYKWTSFWDWEWRIMQREWRRLQRKWRRRDADFQRLVQRMQQMMTRFRGVLR